MTSTGSKPVKKPSGPSSAAVKVESMNMNRAVWLVKVPKYISERWEKAPGDVEVGKLRIKKCPGRKQEVSVDLSQVVLGQPGGEDLPTSHRGVFTKIKNQTLGVFSENRDDNVVSMEGNVVTRIDVQPADDSAYMNLKFESIRKASRVRKPVPQLDRVVLNFKPVSKHVQHVEWDKKMKAEGKKVRADKQVVLDMLFGAFEKHQFYCLKDLVKITQQPVPHLKEILNEICVFSSRPPHRHMWELKPEFRHYDNETA